MAPRSNRDELFGLEGSKACRAAISREERQAAVVFEYVQATALRSADSMSVVLACYSLSFRLATESAERLARKEGRWR